MVWKTFDGRDLNETDIRALIERGRTLLIAGNGAGLDSVRLRLDAQWQVVTETMATDAPEEDF
ncbi:hypothetical protein THIOKS11460018 [Thiocapsa sp. KS1]|nr:hypothetical protein THIOKS11460018 [Thiocapsa sp. KS1]